MVNGIRTTTLPASAWLVMMPPGRGPASTCEDAEVSTRRLAAVLTRRPLALARTSETRRGLPPGADSACSACALPESVSLRRVNSELSNPRDGEELT